MKSGYLLSPFQQLVQYWIVFNILKIEFLIV